jgi:hypothetical protein
MNEVDLPGGSVHRPTEKFKSDRRRGAKDRERDFAGISSKQLARLLLYQQRETRDLERILSDVSRQVQHETARADDSERRAREAALRFRSIDDARRLAEQEVTRAKEELELYKRQLDYAQVEINRAQQVLDSVESQRSDAEQVAASARATARKLKEERMMDIAREEGRRQGMREGLERGRYAGYAEGRYRAMDEVDADEEDGISPNTLEVIGGPIQTFRDTPLASATTETGPDIPAPEPVLPPRPPPSVPYPDDGQIHPVIVHDLYHPSNHAPMNLPPEGLVPNTDDDGRIRLPPPHEMVRDLSAMARPITPATTISPTLTTPLDMEDLAPVQILPPPSAPPVPTHRPHHRTRPRRGSSPDSSTSRSTNLSKMDLISPPEMETGGRLRDRGIPRARERELSVIPEASPAPESLRRPSLQTFTPSIPPASVPAPASTRSDFAEMDPTTRMTPIRPPSATPSAASGLRPPLDPSNRSFRSSTSSAINIQVQPPVSDLQHGPLSLLIACVSHVRLLTCPDGRQLLGSLAQKARTLLFRQSLSLQIQTCCQKTEPHRSYLPLRAQATEFTAHLLGLHMPRLLALFPMLHHLPPALFHMQRPV